MKLTICLESVEFLRTFSNNLYKVNIDISDSTSRLQYIFNNFVHELGPHYNDFSSLFNLNIKIEKEFEESIKELSYMLTSTADKMEVYINFGSAETSFILAKKQDISKRYKDEVYNRLYNEATIKEVRNIFKIYEECVNIIDYQYEGTPYYNSITNSIKLHAMADLFNASGKLSDYFHEVGHLVDNYAGNGHTWLSQDSEFKECLRIDFNAHVNKVILSKNCTEDIAYEIISDEISSNLCANVSDIFGSLSNCRCQGYWGHSVKYWEEDSSRIEKEAFANMFESSIGNYGKKDMMEKYFPKAYSRFKYLIRSV